MKVNKKDKKPLSKKRSGKNRTKLKDKRKKEKTTSRFGRKISILLIIAFLIPSFVTGFVIFSQFKGYVQEDIFSNNEAALDSLETDIENKITSIINVTTILSKVDYVENMQPLLVKSMFINVQEESAMIENIMIVDKKGKIIYSTDGTTGQEEGAFIKHAYNGSVVLSNVMDIEKENVTSKVIKLVIPIYSRSGDVNGVMVTDLSMSAFNEAIQKIEVSEGIEVLVVDNKGRLVADSNTTAFDDKQDIDFTQYEPFERALKKEEDTIPYTFEGTRYLTSFKGLDSIPLGVVTQIEESKALEHITSITYIFVVLLIFIAILGFVVSIILSNYVTRPLNRITQSARVASTGDLTVEVDPRVNNRKDEFGDLARAFSMMVESFSEVVGRLKNSTDILDSTSEELVVSAEDSKSDLDNIVINTNSLKETAHSDIQLSGHVVEGVEEMAKGSENVALNTEKLNILIKNNVEFASKGVSTMEKTAGLVTETFDAYESIESKINSLEKSAVAIGGITDTIMEIANQTNLLALNAAIEAARAGEAGRGFAVVAGEIRNLADQSNKSAENITSIIVEIQDDIKNTSEMVKSTSDLLENVVSESTKSVNQITEILEDSKKAAESVDEISAVTEEQAASSAQINEMMEDMLETIKETAETADNVGELIENQKNKNDQNVERVEDIKKLSKQLKELTSQFKC